MYPEELSFQAPKDLSRDLQLGLSVTHAAGCELADALRMIQHCIGQLRIEQVWSRTDESLNSIGNLLLHLTGNLRQWLVMGLGGGIDERDRPSEFAEREHLQPAELLQRLESCVAEAQSVLARIGPDDLLASRRIQGFELTGMAALWHTVAHFRGHTQEIIGLTRQQLGAQYQFFWVPRSPEEGAPS